MATRDSDLDECSDEATDVEGATSSSQDSPGVRREVLPASMSQRHGKIVNMQDVAFKTLHAFIVYLYTGHIAFAPLYRRPEDPRELVVRPSARSIYRLAHRYNMPELQAKAKEYIIANLTVEKIAQELFRRFTVTYTELHEAELVYALEHFEHVRKTEGCKDIVRSIVRGERAYCEELLLKLLEFKA